MEKYIEASTQEDAIRIGLELIKNDLEDLKKLDPKWLNDLKVMAVLIKKDVFAYRYASYRIRSNKTLAEYVLKKEGILLDSVAEELKKNKKLVLVAVRNYGYAIEFAQEYKKDKDVVMEAVKSHPRALSFAAPELRRDVDLINLAFSKHGPFIIELTAMKVFERVSNEMRWISKRDMEALSKNKIYVYCQKFYDGIITASEMMEFQEMLLKRVTVKDQDEEDFLEETIDD